MLTLSGTFLRSVLGIKFEPWHIRYVGLPRNNL